MRAVTELFVPMFSEGLSHSGLLRHGMQWPGASIGSWRKLGSTLLA